MAHSTLHFSLGWMAGTLVSIPSWFRMRRTGEALSRWFKKWFFWSFALGLFATAPGIFRWFGAPDAFCDGWWMNIFVIYPILNDIKPGGITLGPLLLGACLGAQYLLLVAALWHTRRHTH